MSSFLGIKKIKCIAFIKPLNKPIKIIIITRMSCVYNFYFIMILCL